MQGTPSLRLEIHDLEPISQFANELILQLETFRGVNLLLTNSEKKGVPVIFHGSCATDGVVDLCERHKS
jgi:hypothetical protein